ncbi:ParB/RepB/Spo0J family partition protein [Novosphingobium sp. RD2P27]|uniref:ParB/RepB/Spo0J family partition protein n=1 Tax=Novosphingobium kalidii TaxID=3230299 RepID=A0ABV2D3S9_9SPHN
MTKAAAKPVKKKLADFNMDAMDFSAVPANSEFKAAGRFQRLPIADIDPDPSQVRTEFDQAEIEALAATIAQRGLLQPITVSPTPNGRYVIRYGERRWRACKHLGLDAIDVVLDQGEAERDVGIDQFLENEQRQNLNLEDRVRFIAARVGDDLSTKDLSERIGKPHSEVKRLYSLRTLPDDILKAMKDCATRAAAAVNQAVKIDGDRTRAWLSENANPSVVQAEQFLASLQPDRVEREGRVADEEPTARNIDGSAGAEDAAAEEPVSEANGKPLAEVYATKEGRAPRQPKEPDSAPAIIIQGRRGVIVSGQVSVRFDGESEPQNFEF